MAPTLAKPRTSLVDRIVRYGDLRPCFDAFIDTRTPGSDQKENFTIIGPGVSENPEQHVHIAEAHGFNIGGARQPPGCTNSQHSHDTVEVFYVHTGKWRFDMGEHGDSAQVHLQTGDLISIPTNTFRGFKNVGEDVGYLWAVLGGDDPGQVLWAPSVFTMADQYGLTLLDDGMLIDANKGQTVPAGKSPMPITTRAQIEALDIYTNADLEACVTRAKAGLNGGSFNALPGVKERALIDSRRMNWPHGFSISEVTIEPGSVIPSHSLSVSDVYFIQAGQLIVRQAEEAPSMVSTGDTITFLRGASRQVSNASDQSVTFVAVRGGDIPPAPAWS